MSSLFEQNPDKLITLLAAKGYTGSSALDMLYTAYGDAGHTGDLEQRAIKALIATYVGPPEDLPPTLAGMWDLAFTQFNDLGLP